jgi:hypothetical protein
VRGDDGVHPDGARMGHDVPMNDVVVGVLAILVGALFCFRGFLAMRLVIPIWGAFFGFFLGAGLVDAGSDSGFLENALAWFVAFGFAVFFGLIAYAYYEVCVALALGAIGFTLGTSLMVAIGVTWSWVIVLVGVVLGVALAVLAIVGDLPAVILIVLTAMAGASAVIVGIMLLTNTIDTESLGVSSTTEEIDDDWWWYAGYLVLAIAGVVAQVSDGARRAESLRQQWADAGGRELRVTR